MDGEIVIRSLGALARDAHSYYRAALAIIIFISKQRLGATTRPAVLAETGRHHQASRGHHLGSTLPAAPPRKALPSAPGPVTHTFPSFHLLLHLSLLRLLPLLALLTPRHQACGPPRLCPTSPLSPWTLSSTLFPYSYLLRVLKLGTCLGVQRVSRDNANDAGSIPGQGAEISISRAAEPRRPSCNYRAHVSQRENSRAGTKTPRAATETRHSHINR